MKKLSFVLIGAGMRGQDHTMHACRDHGIDTGHYQPFRIYVHCALFRYIAAVGSPRMLSDPEI